MKAIIKWSGFIVYFILKGLLHSSKAIPGNKRGVPHPGTPLKFANSIRFISRSEYCSQKIPRFI
jgi:hypothetical protein